MRQHQGKLWLDDLVLGISWVLLLVQVLLNQLTINLGFGKHALDIDFSHLEPITLYGATGLSISTFAITLSKISFAVTLIRFTENWARWYVYFAMATLAIFAIPAAVTPWTQCKPLAKTFLDILPGTCINKEPAIQYARFQADDAYHTVIWTVAETSMTIIATSIPVLRVVFKHAVHSAIDGYNRSTDGGTKSRTHPIDTESGALAHIPRMSKRPMGMIVKDCSKESLVDGTRKFSHLEDYLEMEDIVVDERTGRVTAVTPESIQDPTEQKASQWPLCDG
ncbi:hypothetical protein ACEQ8H_001662 [Pleosporales sp. CAS-2024a]